MGEGRRLVTIEGIGRDVAAERRRAGDDREHHHDGSRQGEEQANSV
jgi:hypothetical protein